MEKEREGIVINNVGNVYTVRSEGQDYQCRLKGRFKIKGIRTTNPVAIGDKVKFTISEVKASHDTDTMESEAYIHTILPRKNYIIRRSINLSKEAHILGANLDRTVLVVTVTHPTTPVTFIDRFLATAEAYDVEAALVFNKIDYYKDDELEKVNELVALYEEIGYRCFTVSALKKSGLEELREYLSEGVTLISGQSGAGKSTLINALIPGVNQKTAEVSEAHNTGVHTTAASVMIDIPNSPGSFLIDTPGIKGFGTIDFDPSEVSHYFPEFFRLSDECRFYNCTHLHEPGCRVIDALRKGEIAESRYKSYLSILEDQDASKYREAY